MMSWFESLSDTAQQLTVIGCASLFLITALISWWKLGYWVRYGLISVFVLMVVVATGLAFLVWKFIAE